MKKLSETASLHRLTRISERPHPQRALGLAEDFPSLFSTFSENSKFGKNSQYGK